MAMFGRKTSAPEAPSPSSAQFEIAKSVLAPAIATMIADCEMSPSETQQIGNLCSFSPIYANFSQELLGSLIEQSIKELGSGQTEIIKRAGAVLPPALRETALCFAMRVALADGSINDDERKTLVETAELLDIDYDIFEQILEVMKMLQRPAAV